jgi:hypothetical protein
VNGRPRLPPGFHSGRAGPRGFTVAVDRDAARVTLRGRSTGAGGGAYLTPVPGIELAFDRVGGWLSEVSAAAGQVSDGALGWIADVLGPMAAAVLQDQSRGGTRFLALRARPEMLKVLSRLARLEAARVTSPVPTARLWVAEAADLARQASLPLPGWTHAVAAMPATFPGSLAGTIPGNVTQPPGDGFAAGAGSQRSRRRGDGGRLEVWLDPGLVPHGVFRPGLWPGTDLMVRVHRDGAPLVVAEVTLLPGASLVDLTRCQARLVDADGRRILAAAAFRTCGPPGPAALEQPTAPSRAWAELPSPVRLPIPARSGVAWLEVVDDERRPADGSGLRRRRRALRWADAALRAESRPNGLAPELTDEQWGLVAALAWNRCCADWRAAGDLDRSAQAAASGAATFGATVRRARPFLAELVGHGSVCRAARRDLEANHSREHPPDVLPAAAAALILRCRRGLGRGEPLRVGRIQGGVKLGPASRPIDRQHPLDDGQDDLPVPVRVRGAGGDTLPQLRPAPAQQFTARVIEQAQQRGVLRRRRGQLLAAAEPGHHGRVVDGNPLPSDVLAHALSGVHHHRVEVGPQVCDGLAGRRLRHDVPGFLE